MDQARRRAGDVLRTDEALRKLFDVLGPRYEERVGGYTRVLRCRSRFSAVPSVLSVPCRPLLGACAVARN